jgi:hypothetical protein
LEKPERLQGERTGGGLFRLALQTDVAGVAGTIVWLYGSHWLQTHIPYTYDTIQAVPVRTHWLAGEKQTLIPDDGWYVVREGARVLIQPVGGQPE